MSQNNCENIPNQPYKEVNAISFSDGYSQYLLPEYAALLVKLKPEDPFELRTLYSLYHLTDAEVTAKGIDKNYAIKFSERLVKFNLPWDDSVIDLAIGNLVIKLPKN
jgi:hypothetical protein